MVARRKKIEQNCGNERENKVKIIIKNGKLK